jgi:hypothetical protein
MSWDCITGDLGRDCLFYHFLPPLKGRPKAGGGRAPCPVCRADRAIKFDLIGARPVWEAHCECDDEIVGLAIAAAVACYTHRKKRARKPAADLEEVQALALDRDVTVNALRLGVLEALGMSTAEAAEILKLPRRTLGDARRILAESRRSRGRRILATLPESKVAKTRQKPQVRRGHKAA